MAGVIQQKTYDIFAPGSEAIYRAISDSVPYGIWTADTEGNNTYLSDAFLALTGMKRIQGRGLGWASVLHPDDDDATISRWRESVRSGTPWECEFRVKGIDGGWHPILGRGAPILNDSEGVSGWIGIHLNIANRVRTREIAQRQAEILEQTHDAIFQWELDGRIISWTRGAEHVYGFSREEALGRKKWELLRTEFPGGLETIKEILQGDGRWDGELRHRTRDGQEVIVESRMILWRRPDQPPIIVEANHDITARKRAEEELRENQQKLRDQAEELEQQLIASGRLVSLGQVTASMAHEFNNPLGIIIGFVEDILAGSQPADPHYHSLKIIEEESRRCQKIVQDLMDYGRPTSAEMGPMDLAGAVERSLELVEVHLYKHKVQVVKDLECGLPRIHGDVQQLTQLFVNLYLNAIEAMPDGGTLSVGARVSDPPDSKLIVSVTDSGIGMDASELNKIFLPFYTAKKTRGLGLGLPTCVRIVKNHGGEIKVQSQPGRGTTFEIELPGGAKPG
jgi:PAS domain S-box-containing protein